MFGVTWTGSDIGSGVAYHDVYSATNGGAWTLWKAAITGTQATFIGAVGNTYSFMCAATDNVGLQQSLPAQAQAATLSVPYKVFLPVVLR
jgi:hypothetical protein